MLRSSQFVMLLFTCTFIHAQNEIIVPEHIDAVHFIGLSKKLSDCPEINPLSKNELLKLKQHEDDEIEKGSSGFTVSQRGDETDGALQKTYADEKTGGTAIAILSKWEGVTSAYLRSDNNIAVGPNHVVQLINGNGNSSYIRIWDKAGNLLVGAKKMHDLLGISDWGDPNIIYDEQANRFVMTFLFASNANKLILAVSKTADPTGAYFTYSFDTRGGFPDYEKIAVWGNNYCITVSKAIPGIFLLNRDSILSGKQPGKVIHFRINALPAIGWQGLSAVSQTAASPGGTIEPPVLLRVVDDAWDTGIIHDNIELYKVNVDWEHPKNSTISGPLSLRIKDYNSNLCGISVNKCLPQKGTGVRLWPVSNYITDKAQYRNFADHQSIVGTHVCNVHGSGVAAVRWYELRKYKNTNWFIYQQGTYSPTNDDRWLSSITINSAGTIALGYNITGDTLYPGIRLTGRLAGDTINKMIAAEANAVQGTAYNSTLNYGDYNSMVTDPADGSFWFNAQYNKSNTWSSEVIHFTVHPAGYAAKEDGLFNVYAHNGIHAFTFSLKLNSATAGDAFIEVCNTSGQLVYQHKEKIINGSLLSLVSLNTNLATGIYFAKVSAGGRVFTNKIFIQ